MISREDTVFRTTGSKFAERKLYIPIKDRERLILKNNNLMLSEYEKLNGGFFVGKTSSSFWLCAADKGILLSKCDVTPF